MITKREEMKPESLTREEREVIERFLYETERTETLHRTHATLGLSQEDRLKIAAAPAIRRALELLGSMAIDISGVQDAANEECRKRVDAEASLTAAQSRIATLEAENTKLLTGISNGFIDLVAERDELKRGIKFWQELYNKREDKIEAELIAAQTRIKQLENIEAEKDQDARVARGVIWNVESQRDFMSRKFKDIEVERDTLKLQVEKLQGDFTARGNIIKEQTDKIEDLEKARKLQQEFLADLNEKYFKVLWKMEEMHKALRVTQNCHLCNRETNSCGCSHIRDAALADPAS